MPSFDEQTFHGTRIRPGILSDEPFNFNRCLFEGASVEVRNDATEGILVHDVSMNNCQVVGGGLWGVHLRDAAVINLRVSSLPLIEGCVFERVTLQGKINKLLLNPKLGRRATRGFDSWVETTYKTIDWALDIAELDCPDLDIRGVPARLIRRDPSVHTVLTLEVAQNTDWKSVAQRIPEFRSSRARLTIGLLLQNKWEDIILAAPRSGKVGQREREVQAQLCDMGLAN